MAAPMVDMGTAILESEHLNEPGVNIVANMAMSDLKDKVVIITGSSSGIGEGISYHFASNGCKLSLIGRNKERLENVVANCFKNGLPKENAIYTVGDLTEGSVRNALLANTVTAFGKIDILINNAGIVTIGICADTSEEDYRRVVETNQTIPFMLTQLAIPYLKQSKGNIVNISSITAYRMMYGAVAYSMSKAALNMFTQCLSIELAPYGVRANSVSPGVVQTELGKDIVHGQDQRMTIFTEEAKRTPLGRNGTTSEIAEAVGFLASDKASWITGENMIIDGGRHGVSSGLYVCDMKYKQRSVE